MELKENFWFFIVASKTMWKHVSLNWSDRKEKLTLRCCLSVPNNNVSLKKWPVVKKSVLQCCREVSINVSEKTFLRRFHIVNRNCTAKTLTCFIPFLLLYSFETCYKAFFIQLMLLLRLVSIFHNIKPSSNLRKQFFSYTYNMNVPNIIDSCLWLSI